MGLSILIAVSCFAVPTDDLADHIVSIFENSTPEIQYCAIEDVKDGRGYTAGAAGFTTATGDLYELVIRYHKINPDTPFAGLEGILREKARHQDGSIVGLETLPEIWKSVCDTPFFKQAQDQLVNDYYKKPARKYVKKYQLKSQLAYLIIYDTIIQHGDGDDPDSFQGVISKMNFIPEGETEFLKEFLRARIEILNCSTNPSTRDTWHDSVDRAWALLRLIDAGEFELKTPLTLHVWGEDWVLK